MIRRKEQIFRGDASCFTIASTPSFPRGNARACDVGRVGQWAHRWFGGVGRCRCPLLALTWISNRHWLLTFLAPTCVAHLHTSLLLMAGPLSEIRTSSSVTSIYGADGDVVSVFQACRNGHAKVVKVGFAQRTTLVGPVVYPTCSPHMMSFPAGGTRLWQGGHWRPGSQRGHAAACCRLARTKEDRQGSAQAWCRHPCQELCWQGVLRACPRV